MRDSLTPAERLNFPWSMCPAVPTMTDFTKISLQSSIASRQQ